MRTKDFEIKIDMSILDKIVIIIVNLAIIIVAGFGSAVILASSKEYYHRQFEENGIYAKINDKGETDIRPICFVSGNSKLIGYFTDKQLNFIVDHITDFLFGGTESFELYMDDANLNGELTDNVKVFGDRAISHMNDVRALMRFGRGASILCLILLPFLIAYIIWRRRECSDVLLKYTVIFFGALLLLLLVMCVFSLARGGNFLSSFWETAHHLFFPFQPDKVAGSFFNDALTMILTPELFMDAVAIVLLSLATALALWFGGIYFLHKKYYKTEKCL